jgi:hypothetical protein
VLWISAEPVCQHTTGRTCAHNDEIEICAVHCIRP